MKPFRERNPVAVGLASIAALLVAFAAAFSINRFPFITGVYLLKADFADASGLTPENEVRVAGLKVGKVRSVELAGDRVRVTFEVRGGVRLGSASSAEIKLKTLLGAKFLGIETKGGAPYLRGGDRIPLGRTAVPFELYELTNQAVGTLRDVDAPALNDALRELARVTEDPNGNFGRALDGLAKATADLAQRDRELESLVVSADRLLAALAGRSEELGRILDAGADVLSALAARRQALKDFVRGTDRLSAQLASLVQSTRGSLDPALRDLHTALEVVRVNVGNVEETVRVLGPTAESFGRAFTQGRWGDIFTQSIVVPIPQPDLSGGAGARRGLAALYGGRP